MLCKYVTNIHDVNFFQIKVGLSVYVRNVIRVDTRGWFTCYGALEIVCVIIKLVSSLCK